MNFNTRTPEEQKEADREAFKAALAFIAPLVLGLIITCLLAILLS